MIPLTSQLVALSVAILFFLYLPSAIESSECTEQDLIHIGGVDLEDVPECEQVLSPVRKQCVDQYMASVRELTSGKNCDLHSEWIKKALCCGVWEAKRCLVDQSAELPQCGQNISSRYQQLPSDRNIVSDVYDNCSEYGEGAPICDDSYQSSAFSLNTLAIVLVIVLGLVFVIAFAWKLITKRKQSIKDCETGTELCPKIFGKFTGNTPTTAAGTVVAYKPVANGRKATMDHEEMNNTDGIQSNNIQSDETDSGPQHQKTDDCEDSDLKNKSEDHVETVHSIVSDHDDSDDKNKLGDRVESVHSIVSNHKNSGYENSEQQHQEQNQHHDTSSSDHNIPDNNNNDDYNYE